MSANVRVAVLATAFAVALAGCSSHTQHGATGTAPAASPPSEATSKPAAQSGAVERNYPTVAEQKALKLGYPPFLGYGPDSARLTPFPPGWGKQPVSVKLAPGAGGYVLKAEGDACKFPVSYQIKAADGKTLASGDYRGTAALDLPGWNQQTGTAILTLRMASSALNNFGCNIVVTRK